MKQLLTFGKRNQTQKNKQGFELELSQRSIVAVILLIALFSFEIFNFDTTQYALESLLGEINFVGIGWATILAVAFCAIDFAGLARLFTPEKGWAEPKEIWYLTGAWLLGATMNAAMTWWAVSLAVIEHDLGNEILSREQLLQVVPVFVAVLVWLTRILFIGACSVAGDHLLHPLKPRNEQQQQQRPSTQPLAPAVQPMMAAPTHRSVTSINTQTTRTTAKRHKKRPAINHPVPNLVEPTATNNYVQENYVEENKYRPIPAPVANNNGGAQRSSNIIGSGRPSPLRHGPPTRRRMPATASMTMRSKDN